MPRRLLALVLVALAAGCGGDADPSAGADEDSGGVDDGSGGGGAPPLECQADLDCVAVASTCCECPSFAVPAEGDGEGDFADACDAIECEPIETCPAVEAVCGDAGCELVCAAVVTERQCAGGFVRDAAGCLVDACAPPPEAPACQVADDCVRVAADCCGCASGGEDTAVPADEADDHAAGLGCTGDASCPGVDTCEPGLEPACLAGQCALMGTTGGDPDDDGREPTYCGTPDYPSCPEGTVCVLNGTSADAATLGVGACQIP